MEKTRAKQFLGKLEIEAVIWNNAQQSIVVFKQQMDEKKLTDNVRNDIADGIQLAFDIYDVILNDFPANRDNYVVRYNAHLKARKRIVRIYAKREISFNVFRTATLILNKYMA